jgi:hypothetical protein
MTLSTDGEVSQEVIKGENTCGAPRGGFHQSSSKKKNNTVFSILSRRALKDLCEAVDVYRAPPGRSRE